MDLIKLLDVSNPKKIKDTINLLIENYEGFGDDIRAIADQAAEDSAAALLAGNEAKQIAQNSATTLLQSITQQNNIISQNFEEQDEIIAQNTTTSNQAKQIAEDALAMIEQADARSQAATETAEDALDLANESIETSELAMNIATEAKSTVDQAISTGVFGTFVHNPAGVSLLHAYMTDNLEQENTDDYFYMATPKLVRDALTTKLSPSDLKDYTYSVTGDGYWTLNTDNTISTSAGTVSNKYSPLTGSVQDFGTLTRATNITPIITAHNTLVNTVNNKLDKLTYQFIKDVFVNNPSGWGGSYPFHVCNIPVNSSMYDIIIKVKSTTNMRTTSSPHEETVYIKKVIDELIVHYTSATKSNSYIRLYDNGTTLGVYFNAIGTTYATIEIYGAANYITGEPTFIMERVDNFPSGVITPTLKEYYVANSARGQQYSTTCYGKIGYTPGARAVMQCGSDVPLDLVTSETANGSTGVSLTAGQHLSKVVVSNKSYNITATEVTTDNVTKRVGMYGDLSTESNNMFGSLIPSSNANLGRNKGIYATHAHWNDLYITRILLGDDETDITELFATKDDIPTLLSELTEDSTHRLVTDTEKDTWNAKPTININGVSQSTIDFDSDPQTQLDNMVTLNTEQTITAPKNTQLSINWTDNINRSIALNKEIIIENANDHEITEKTTRHYEWNGSDGTGHVTWTDTQESSQYKKEISLVSSTASDQYFCQTITQGGTFNLKSYYNNSTGSGTRYATFDFNSGGVLLGYRNGSNNYNLEIDNNGIDISVPDYNDFTINGVPIIESGSNANGYWVILGNKILICAGQFNKSQNVTVTLPHAYKSTEYKVVCQHASGSMRGNYTNTGDVRNLTTTSFQFDSNHSEKDNYHYITMGRYE